MAFLDWSDDLATGYLYLDTEHQHLISLTNALYEAAMARRHHAALCDALAELIEHMATHFRHEETLMTQIGYPGLAAHREEHIAIVDEYLTLQRRFERRSISLKADFFSHVRHTMCEHIQKSDSLLGQALLRTKPVRHAAPPPYSASTTRSIASV